MPWAAIAGARYGVGSMTAALLSSLDIAHHFSDGIYAKETFIPQGMCLQQHEHPHGHLSILASGTARVIADGVASVHVAPAVIDMPAHVRHEVQAMTECVWYCVWRTDETDPERVDQVLIGG